MKSKKRLRRHWGWRLARTMRAPYLWCALSFHREAGLEEMWRSLILNLCGNNLLSFWKGLVLHSYFTTLRLVILRVNVRTNNTIIINEGIFITKEVDAFTIMIFIESNQLCTGTQQFLCYCDCIRKINTTFIFSVTSAYIHLYFIKCTLHHYNSTLQQITTKCININTNAR